MLEIQKIWNTPEMVAFAIHLLVMTVSVVFIIVTVHFIIFKEPTMIKQKKD